MKKMNKKGFTLIEMLVVIAIIAVLVSIIVPVVGSSTVKASAAANAANLRTVMAEVSTKVLSDPEKYPVGDYTSVSGTVTFGTGGPTMTVPQGKAINITGCVVADKCEMTVSITADRVTATYGTVTIETLSDVADDGKVG